jgi:hypothetical protein
MNYIELQLEIDALREYIDTELCKKCDQMQRELDRLKEQLLNHESEQK